MGWHTIRQYRRPPIESLFALCRDAASCTTLLLEAEVKAKGASEGTIRKWRRAHDRRIEQLRTQPTFAKASSFVPQCGTTADKSAGKGAN